MVVGRKARGSVRTDAAPQRRALDAGEVRRHARDVAGLVPAALVRLQRPDARAVAAGLELDLVVDAQTRRR